MVLFKAVSVDTREALLFLALGAVIASASIWPCGVAAKEAKGAKVFPPSNMIECTGSTALSYDGTHDVRCVTAAELVARMCPAGRQVKIDPVKGLVCVKPLGK